MSNLLVDVRTSRYLVVCKHKHKQEVPKKNLSRGSEKKETLKSKKKTLFVLSFYLAMLLVGTKLLPILVIEASITKISPVIVSKCQCGKN